MDGRLDDHAAALLRHGPPGDAERAVRVTVTGELDLASVGELDRSLRRYEADALLLVLDLSGLEFLDGCGAHLLLAAHHRMRRAGRRLVVTRGCPEVQWFFALIGLDQILDVVEDHEAEPPLARSWAIGGVI